MDAAAVVTIAIATVVVLVLAAYLIAVIRVLVDTSGKLTTVIAAVGAIVQKTEPVEPVVRSINGSLTKAQDVLMSLLESKAGDQGAADLIASVDPLAGTPSFRRTRPSGDPAPGPGRAAPRPEAGSSRGGRRTATRAAVLDADRSMSPCQTSLASEMPVDHTDGHP